MIIKLRKFFLPILQQFTEGFCISCSEFSRLSRDQVENNSSVIYNVSWKGKQIISKYKHDVFHNAYSEIEQQNI